MKKILTITTIITGFAVSAALFAAASSDQIDLMKEPTRSFSLASELNPGATGLQSERIEGKKTGDILTAAEYNRILEVLASGGNELPTGCDDNATIIYDATSGSWICDNGSTVDLSSISSTCTSIQVSADEIKTVCEYTGSDQIVQAPSGYAQATVKAWGAGGGGSETASGNGLGGGAGYTESSLSVSSGQNLTVVVGEGGKVATATPSYGGGGAGGEGDFMFGSSGGGMSAIYDGSKSIQNLLVVAGGGGGSGRLGTSNSGGAGGGINGESAASNASHNIGNQATGGTQNSGGQGGSCSSLAGDNGSSLQGGNGEDGDWGHGGGGGGGGYYGGGGGIGDQDACTGTSPVDTTSSGAGGSGYCAASMTSCTTTQGSGRIPAGISDTDYVSNIGLGGNLGLDGGDGLVVITWTK